MRGEKKGSASLSVCVENLAIVGTRSQEWFLLIRGFQPEGPS